MAEKTIYELSSPGRLGVKYPEPDVPLSPLPKELLRAELPLPELSELDVVRHFTNLSKLNYSIDGGYYPLGSCTMKYNPKVNEEAARLPGFAYLHPLQSEETLQGALAMMYTLQEWLAEISGFSAVSLQPAAGAQGEFTGVMIIRAYHHARGDHKRNKMLIPDSASPASRVMKPADCNIFLSANTMVGESSIIRARVSSRAFTRLLRRRSSLTGALEGVSTTGTAPVLPKAKVERNLSRMPTTTPLFEIHPACPCHPRRPERRQGWVHAPGPWWCR